MADFFGIFLHLAEALRKAKDENEQRKLAAERAAKRNNAAQNKASSGLKMGTDDGAQRGVLDSLMNKLAAGPVQLRKVERPVQAAQPATSDLQAAFAKFKKG